MNRGVRVTGFRRSRCMDVADHEHAAGVVDVSDLDRVDAPPIDRAAEVDAPPREPVPRDSRPLFASRRAERAPPVGGIRRIGLAAAGARWPSPDAGQPTRRAGVASARREGKQGAESRAGPALAEARLPRPLVDGRRIYAVKVGDVDNPRSVLVVGDIHGNESAGIPGDPDARFIPSLSRVADHRDQGPQPRWSRGRDPSERPRGRPQSQLPLPWRPLGSPGDPQYSGPHPSRSPRPASRTRSSCGLAQGHHLVSSAHSGSSTNRRQHLRRAAVLAAHRTAIAPAHALSGKRSGLAEPPPAGDHVVRR